MTTTGYSKENDCDFSLFKTPLRTPVRNGHLSNVKLHDLGFYSNNVKHMKFMGSANLSELQRCNDSMTTPIRLNKTKYSTPGSIQRRRALGLVNSNSNHIHHEPSIDDFSRQISKQDESVILQAPAPLPNIDYFIGNNDDDDDDDLPHQSNEFHSYENTFDDLIPCDERVEHMINQTHGINIFTYSGGLTNSLRCQSPLCSRVDMSTLLDILD